VERIGLPVAQTPENLRYLTTKRDRMGHDLPGLPLAAGVYEQTPRRGTSSPTVPAGTAAPVSAAPASGAKVCCGQEAP
jgi:3,4-dihydroxy 2-butanone 4-phosphate synthase/GTP cyclohydrolase II